MKMILMGKTRQAENITYKLLPNRKSSSIQCKKKKIQEKGERKKGRKEEEIECLGVA